MQLGLSNLYEFLDNADGQALVLATVTNTIGASYRKAGAMMLIDQQARSSGLVSGGCLEDDLIAHAQPVFSSGLAKTVVYDLSQEESASLWGLGLGCGGEIHILLERIDAQNLYGGLQSIRAHWQQNRSCGLLKIIHHQDAKQTGQFQVCCSGEPIDQAFGGGQYADQPQALQTALPEATLLQIPVSPSKRLLICGAGPDAIPLAQIASAQHWFVSVADHRPDYVDQRHFKTAAQLICATPKAVISRLEHRPNAAVVMTHNVERDCEYLRLLEAMGVPYIGLLGPGARRDLLLEKAGVQLREGIHGPAGLDLAAVLPEEIAFSIFAQIQAHTHQRHALPLSSF